MPTKKSSQVIETSFLIALSDSPIVLSVSESIHGLLGFKADDFLSGKVTLQSRIHSHDQDIADELFSSDIKQATEAFNIRIRNAGDRICCARGQYTKVIKKNDNNLTLQLVLQDAKSLWKRPTEKSMMANFKSMMENTNDYIYFKDRNHVFTGASQTLVAITDPSEHWTDLLGKTDYDLFSEEYADIYYSLEKKVFDGIDVAHEVQETIDNEGNKGWVDNRKYPIRDEHNEIIGLFGIARDITESKKIEETLRLSEKRFREIFEEAPLGVALIDSLTGDIYEVNPRFAEIAGRTIEEMATIDWMSITHPDDVQEDLDNMADLNAGKINGFNMNKRYIKPDDSYVWINMTIAPITVEDKTKPRHLCMIEDITLRKKSEEELQKHRSHLAELVEEQTKELKESQDKLHHADKLASLGKLVGSVAHEFNNPLFGVTGIVDQLGEDLPPEEREKLSSVGKKECWRMAGMIKNLQSFYKPSEGIESDIKMSSLVEDVLLVVGKDIKQKGINIIKNFPDDEVSIKGVDDQIKQIVINLLQNAAESISGTDGEISLTVQSDSSNIILKVQDNGEGIPKEDIDKLFEPFFTSKGVKGTGLGLSVSYGIVKKHDGEITVESELGKGSIFTLTLPNSNKT